MADPPVTPPTYAQRALKWAIFVAAAAFVGYLCVLILKPFLDVLAWAAVLAITFHPWFEALVRKTGRSTLSALLCSVLVVIAFLIPVLTVGGLALTQLLSLIDSFQQTFMNDTGVDTTTTWGRAYAWLAGWSGLDANAVVPWIRRHGSEVARVAAQYSLTIAASVSGAVVSVVFIIFAMFLLFRDGSRLVSAIPGLLPFERAHSEALLIRVREVIHGSVYGIVVIAVIQGALCGGMFWLLGVPSAALWGTVTVLMSVLPVFGSAVVWVPGAIYLASTGHWPQAAVLAVWGTFAISGVDNFLRPRLVGERVGLSEITMFFALLGGLQAFGLLGIVLGPVVFAIAGAVIEMLGNDRALADQEIPPDRG